MPQSNQRVSRFDLVSDLNNYYNGSVASVLVKGKRTACKIEGYQGDGNRISAYIRMLPEGKTSWESQTSVPDENLDYILPPLGMIKFDGRWFYLNRSPARRMRKGYNEDNIHWCPVGHEFALEVNIRDPRIVHQIWYGSPEAITNNIVVIGQNVYYTTDHVATIDKDGLVVFIPEREKLGELVCKTLANNWDAVVSKTSVRTLP